MCKKFILQGCVLFQAQGAFHSTKNSENFETRTNGWEYLARLSSQFPEILKNAVVPFVTGNFPKFFIEWKAPAVRKQTKTVPAGRSNG